MKKQTYGLNSTVTDWFECGESKESIIIRLTTCHGFSPKDAHQFVEENTYEIPMEGVQTNKE